MATFENITTDAPTTIERDGFKLSAKLHLDLEQREPWNEEDGHGPVSGWRNVERLPKQPGELELVRDGTRARFYDYANACRIARKDGWGPSAYRLDIEQGANGLQRANAQWFIGRELLAFTSAWYDDPNGPIADVYAQLRASMTPKAYAALAARQDYERLRKFLDGQWGYVGVVVTASREDVELGHASLWGIETDSDPSYFVEVAEELAEEAIEQAREMLAKLCDCDGKEDA